MFDLEQAVAQWRQELLATGIKAPQVLDELEAHLREDVGRQSKSGTCAQDAFGIAVQNLGKAHLLKNEFGKIRRASALEKLMIGIGALFVCFIVLLSALAVFLCYESWADRIMASSAVACILLVACRWRFAVPFLPLIAHTRLRWGIGLGCIVCGPVLSSIFCNYILPYFDVSPDHQLPAIGVWAVFMIAAFTCAGLGLLMSERDREIRGMTRSSITKFLNLPA